MVTAFTNHEKMAQRLAAQGGASWFMRHVAEGSVCQQLLLVFIFTKIAMSQDQCCGIIATVSETLCLNHHGCCSKIMISKHNLTDPTLLVDKINPNGMCTDRTASPVKELNGLRSEFKFSSGR